MGSSRWWDHEVVGPIGYGILYVTGPSRLRDLLVMGYGLGVVVQGWFGWYQAWIILSSTCTLWDSVEMVWLGWGERMSLLEQLRLHWQS